VREIIPEATPEKIDSRSDNESEFRIWSRRTSGFEARGFGAALVCSRSDRSLRNCANRTRQRANRAPAMPDNGRANFARALRGADEFFPNVGAWSRWNRYRGEDRQALVCIRKPRSYRFVFRSGDTPRHRRDNGSAAMKLLGRMRSSH